jgi:hypothetical protein
VLNGSGIFGLEVIGVELAGWEEVAGSLVELSGWEVASVCDGVVTLTVIGRTLNVAICLFFLPHPP